MALLCAVQNEATFDLNWIQTRPRITQYFGNDLVINGVHVYQQFDLKAHDGIDYGIPVGTKVFAGIDGIVKVVDSGNSGYGLHVKIRNPFKDCEIILGHLSAIRVANGQRVSVGDLIGLSGNTGFSTAPHLHEGFRRIIPDDNEKDVFKWKVADYNNGYKGYIDHLEYLITWKGGFLKNSL